VVSVAVGKDFWLEGY